MEDKLWAYIVHYTLNGEHGDCVITASGSQNAAEQVRGIYPEAKINIVAKIMIDWS